MPYVPLKLPSGMMHQGTVYDAKGRYYDGNLVRWLDGTLKPWGGWTVARASTGSGTRNAKPVRGMLNFKTTNLYTRIALGTYQKVFIFETSDSTFWDITPAGFTAGNQHGNGDLSEASCWSFDEWPYAVGATTNPQLVGVQRGDGILYTQNSWATPTAAMVAVSTLAGASGVPGSNHALVVTPEKFLMLLGAGGSPNTVAWCDQGNFLVWTDLPTNQAGTLDLPGSGWLMAGKRGKNETILWTDANLYAARYVGLPFVYQIVPVGFQCGAISRRCMAMAGGIGYWMGNGSFWMYDGATREIPCEVSNYVFGRLNLSQRSKVAAVPSPETNEIIWYYPSGSSSTGDCDSYVAFNYVEGVWSLGFINRSDGVERAGYDYPIHAGVSGALYKHENATTYAEEDASTLTPYIESGPIELGDGDRTMMVRQYIPDEATLGGVNLSLLWRMYPTATETTAGPYTAANPTDIRLTARQVRLKYTQVSGGWRVGTPRLEVVAGSRR